MDWIFWCVIYSGGYLYSGGLDILVCYLYSGGLSLLCWDVFILLAVYVWCVIFIMLGYLYSGGLSLFWWAICILVGYLYSGGLSVFLSVFWWDAYSLPLFFMWAVY